MKVFHSLVIGLSLLVFTGPVLAQNNVDPQVGEPAAAPSEENNTPKSCTCSVSVTGNLCNVSESMAFSIGSQVSVGQILDQVSFLDCPAKIGVPPEIAAMSLSLNEETCEQAKSFNASQEGYDVSLECNLSNEQASENGGNGQGQSPSSRTFGNPDPTPIIPLINPIGGTAEDPQGQTNISQIVGNVIKVALGIIGSITLGIFVYGGFLWLTSAGNSEKVSQGSSAMLYAVIGLFIIFGAYAILNTIISGIRGGASGGIGSLQTQDTKPTENQPQTAAEICKTLKTRADCRAFASEGCTYVTFLLPTKVNLEECAPNEERERACMRYFNICKEGLDPDDEFLDDCTIEYEQCTRR